VRSRRWEELLRPAGTGDELRALLTTGGMPWGSLVLYRAGRVSRFSGDDVKVVASIRGALTGAARASWTAWPAASAEASQAPATLIAATDGTLLDATPEAYARLTRMGAGAQAGYTTVYALLARLAADLSHDADGRATASVVTRTTDGRWVELHAAPLAGLNRPGRLAAVTIRAAPSARVRAVLLHAYALSQRERQVAGLAADGLPSRDIAATLYISPHTARDHLKAVFRKTRSHTRQELAARLGGAGP
jgi:DNA-binding CsgD family transcriptional regulator